MPALAFIAVAGQSPAAKAAEAWDKAGDEAAVLEQLARLTAVKDALWACRTLFR